MSTLVDLVTQVRNILPLANGGLGIAVSNGDLVYFNGASWIYLPANGAGVKVLKEDASGNPSWAAVDWSELSGIPTTFTPTPHNILSVAHGDTLADSVVRGDIMVGNPTPKWARLPKGTANQVLTMDGTATDVTWADPAGGTPFVPTASATGATGPASSYLFCGVPYEIESGQVIDLSADGNIVFEISDFAVSQIPMRSDSPWNILVGVDAGPANHLSGVPNEGLYNLFIGNSAGFSNITGYKNVFLGVGAGYYNVDGTYMTCVGVNAGGNSPHSSFITAIGKGALEVNDGASMTGVGAHAGAACLTARDSTFLGDGSGNTADQKTDAVNCLGLGYRASCSADNQAVLGNNSVVSTILRGYQCYQGATEIPSGDVIDLSMDADTVCEIGDVPSLPIFYDPANNAFAINSRNTGIDGTAGANLLVEGPNGLLVKPDDTWSAGDYSTIVQGDASHYWLANFTGYDIFKGANGLQFSTSGGSAKITPSVNLLLPADTDINFGTTEGASGYGFRDNSGIMEEKKQYGGWGQIVSVLANVRRSAQTAATPATTIYTTPLVNGAGLYRISFQAAITTPAGTSSVLGGTNSFQVIYTDATSSAVVTTPAGLLYNATAASLAVNSTQVAQSGTMLVYAKANTNIQVSYDYTSVGAPAMQYDLRMRVEFLQM